MAWGKGKKEKRAMPDTLAADMLAAGYEPRSMMTRRPLPYLSPEEALTHPMVQRCVAYLASRIAATPMFQYVDGSSETKETTPSPIVVTPSARLSRYVWLQTVVRNTAMYGNCTPLIVRRAGRYATQAEMVDPRNVRYDEYADVLVDRRNQVIPWDDVLHFRYPGMPSPSGAWAYSPIMLNNQTISLGVTARGYAAGVFNEDGIPPALLYSKTPLNADQAKDIKDAYYRSRTNSREIAVLGADLQFEKLAVTPEESQFIETQDRVDADICTMFGLPGELFGAGRSGSAVTYANLEQRSKALYDNTFATWFKMIEDVLSAQTPTAESVRFDTSTFVTPDQLTQAQIGQITTRAGLLTRNEWRFDQDRPPIDGGDVAAVSPEPATATPALAAGGTQ